MIKRRSVLIAEAEPSLAKHIELLLVDICCDVFIEHSGIGAVRRGDRMHRKRTVRCMRILQGPYLQGVTLSC